MILMYWVLIVLVSHITFFVRMWYYYWHDLKRWLRFIACGCLLAVVCFTRFVCY